MPFIGSLLKGISGRNLSHKRNSLLELGSWWLQVSPNTRETKESVEFVEVNIKRGRTHGYTPKLLGFEFADLGGKGNRQMRKWGEGFNY
jgi:hypothetical protein